MVKQQDDEELDRSTAGPATSVSTGTEELPVHPSDATVPNVNVEPNSDDADSRMSEIKEILGYAAMPLLERCELVAEWVNYVEARLSVSGQVDQKPQGRPEGGIARAARELAVPGKTPEARRQFIKRAIKIKKIWPEAKAEARISRLDDVQSALLDIAQELSADAQIAKVQEIAARRAVPRRRKKNTDRSPLSPEDQLAFDAAMAAWARSTELRAVLVAASAVVLERVNAALRSDIASASSRAG
jgi:hypothetical protein